MIRSLQNRNLIGVPLACSSERHCWGLSCAWNEGGEMDFSASLSSAPERHGRVESQLGVIQQPRDMGQDSAVRARNWLMLANSGPSGSAMQNVCRIHPGWITPIHCKVKGSPCSCAVYNPHKQVAALGSYRALCGSPVLSPMNRMCQSGSWQETEWTPTWFKWRGFYEGWAALREQIRDGLTLGLTLRAGARKDMVITRDSVLNQERAGKGFIWRCIEGEASRTSQEILGGDHQRDKAGAQGQSMLAVETMKSWSRPWGAREGTQPGYSPLSLPCAPSPLPHSLMPHPQHI